MQGSVTQNGKPVIIRNKRKFGFLGFFFALIPLCGFIVFSLFPIGYSIYLSMTDITLSGTLTNGGEINLVGIANYITVFNDMRFWHSIAVAFYAMLGQFMSLSVALAMSALLSTKVKGWNLFSVLYFVPYICSSIAISMIWLRMFDGKRGIINEILIMFGRDPAAERIDWLKREDLYMIIFFFVQAWHAPGYGIIMYNAAFSAIDHTLYEAARIDGASRLKQLTSITLPAISPTTYFLVMLGLINGLQQFEMFQVFTGLSGSWTGTYGPNDAGLVPLLYIYSIRETKMAEACSMSWFMFFIVFTVGQLNQKLQKVWVANENE